MKISKRILFQICLLFIGGSATGQTQTFPTPLNDFGGFYTFNFPNGKAYIQIKPGETTLTLLQIWDNKAIEFTRTNDLEFTSPNPPFSLKFSKEANGVIHEMLAAGQDLWKRTLDYKPVVLKDIALSPKQLKAFEGYFQLRSNDNYVQFYSEGGKLMAKQLWNGRVHQLLAQSEMEFISQEDHIPVKFIRDAKGEISIVEAADNEVLDRVKDYKPSGN